MDDVKSVKRLHNAAFQEYVFFVCSAICLDQ